MKNTLKVTFALIFSLTFFACSEDEIKVENSQNLLSEKTIQHIGVKHNKALDQVLKGLKENISSLSVDNVNISDLINNELNKYYQTISNTSEDVKKANFYSKKGVSKFLNRRGEHLRKSNTENLSPIENAIQENKEYLSEGQIELLTMCNEVLKNAPSNLGLSISTLDKIQSLAKQRLTEKDAQLILIAAEIGKASLQYWNDNFDEWQQILTKHNSNNKTILMRKQYWFDWGDVAGADVEGAVTGAVGAAVVNLAPGAGQIAYGAAIVGGAAGYSAGNAVRQIWNRFFR